jgi:hypothetical protein
MNPGVKNAPQEDDSALRRIEVVVNVPKRHSVFGFVRTHFLIERNGKLKSLAYDISKRHQKVPSIAFERRQFSSVTQEPDTRLLIEGGNPRSLHKLA